MAMTSLNVGDKVRLPSAPRRVMTVSRIVRGLTSDRDIARCTWHDPETHDEMREAYPAGWLVRVAEGEER